MNEQNLNPEEQCCSQGCEEQSCCNTSKLSIPAFLWVAICIFLFSAGALFGYSLLNLLSINEITPETPVVDVQDPIDEPTAEEGVLAINWIPVEEQTLINTPQDIIDRYFRLDEDVSDDPDALWYERTGYTQEELDYFASRELVLTDDESNQELSDQGYHTFLLGTVREGTYEDYRLVLSYAGIPSMGVNYHTNYYLLSPDGNASSILLERYSTEVSSVFTKPRNYTNTESEQALTIPELEEPTEALADKDGNLFVFNGIWNRNDYPSNLEPNNYRIASVLEDFELREYLADHPDSPSLQSTDRGFFYTREDGRTLWFDLEVPFWTSPYVQTGEEAMPPQITWSSGTQNDQLFTKGSLGGCGMTSYTSVVSIDDYGTLEKTGTYSVKGRSGSIYEPENKDTELYQSAYENAKRTDEELTEEDFLTMHPYFYWQDNLGRWIEFTNTSVLPASECGKPVIYLYPEKTTDLSVEIELKGGMSKSVPDYESGWNITAYPNGTLTNKADGELYPYLFWEGSGDLYLPPNDYWIVAQEKVEPFLYDTLATLGLNDRETEDFLEFWLPLMQDAPYYQIGFHGTSVMNQIAPLTLSEEPNTLLRILMDYTELDAPIEENPPKLPRTPIRKGFTVIEWGGVLR